MAQNEFTFFNSSIVLSLWLLAQSNFVEPRVRTYFLAFVNTGPIRRQERWANGVQRCHRVCGLTASHKVRLGCRPNDQTQDCGTTLTISKLRDPSAEIEPITCVLLGGAGSLHDSIERQPRSCYDFPHFSSVGLCCCGSSGSVCLIVGCQTVPLLTSNSKTAAPRPTPCKLWQPCEPTQVPRSYLRLSVPKSRLRVPRCSCTAPR
jgi:hypothetical protein